MTVASLIVAYALLAVVGITMCVFLPCMETRGLFRKKSVAVEKGSRYEGDAGGRAGMPDDRKKDRTEGKEGEKAQGER